MSFLQDLGRTDTGPNGGNEFQELDWQGVESRGPSAGRMGRCRFKQTNCGMQRLECRTDPSLISGASPMLQVETLQKSKEEAHITADAFRIAFEQQLTRKNDQALRLARGDVCRRVATWVNRQRVAEGGTWGACGRRRGL